MNTKLSGLTSYVSVTQAFKRMIVVRSGVIGVTLLFGFVTDFRLWLVVVGVFSN